LLGILHTQLIALLLGQSIIFPLRLRERWAVCFYVGQEFCAAWPVFAAGIGVVAKETCPAALVASIEMFWPMNLPQAVIIVSSCS